jgi:hippurate hydrolase
MVTDGLFERFPMQEMFGFHNWPYAPKGQFQISEGYVLAAADVFSIRLTGRGGHGAFPHKASDLVLGASQIAIALQSIVSREIDAHKPAVVSITNLNAGTGAVNVLPTEAVLSGTARSFDPGVRNLIEERLTSISHGIANTFGLTATVEYSRICDAVFNNGKSASYARSAARSIVSTSNVVEQMPNMGGEDFGFFLERVPGAFVFVGQAGLSGDSSHSQGLHTSRYDFNDEIIPIVVEFFAELAETRLSLSQH